jgi:GT2 family glycosyltransferase
MAKRISALEAERKALTALSISYDQLLDGLVRTRRFRLAQAIGNAIESIPERPRAWLERLGRLAGGKALLKPRHDTDRVLLERERLQKRLHAMLYANGAPSPSRSPLDLLGSRPLVSVVSVLYNSAATIEAFLQAFTTQDYTGPIEIVLVDDASTDDSATLATAFAAANSTPQRTITVIRNEHNLGNCLARNAGVAAAGGDIICILDSDCIVNEGFVAAHVAMHTSGYDAVIGPMGIESMGEPAPDLLAELLADRARLQSRMRLQDPTNLESATNCVTRNFSVSRRVVQGLGRELFDPRFTYRNAPDTGYGWEDVEMGAALRQWGTRIGFTWDAVSIHLSHRGSVSDRTRAVGSARNFALLIDTHPYLLVEARDWATTTVDRIASWVASTGSDPAFYLAPVYERLRQPGTRPEIEVCVYTAVAGGYRPLSRSLEQPGVACRLFSDGATADGWEPYRFDELSEDAVRTAKKPKILPHLYFEDCDWSIWIDANISLRSDPRDLVAEVEQSGQLIGVFPHPERSCVYDEAMRCVSGAKDDVDIILQQIGRYRREGFPEHIGLAECNVLVRRHSNPGVVAAMRLWWDEIRAGSRRDQISFNYSLWRSGLSYHELGGGRTNVRTDPRFVYQAHPGTKVAF